MSSRSSGKKSKYKPSASTQSRRRQDAEVQQLYSRVRGSEDTVSEVQRAVTQLTLISDGSAASHQSPSYPPSAGSVTLTPALSSPTDLHRDALRDELKTLERAGQIIRDAQAALPLIDQSLVFVNDPRSYGDYRRRDMAGMVTANSGPHALHADAAENTQLLKYESNLVNVLGALTGPNHISHPEVDPLRQSLRSRVLRDLEGLEVTKKDEWDRQRAGIPLHECHKNTIRTDEFLVTPWTLWSPREVVIHTIFLVSLVMHLLEGLPRRSTELLLAGFCATTAVTLSYARESHVQFSMDPGLSPESMPSSDTELTPEDDGLVNDIECDPRVVLRRYNLEPIVHTYTCCSRCFALYPSTSTPRICTYKSVAAGAPCGAPLIRDRAVKGVIIPSSVRNFLHQPLDKWIGRLICREGVEDLFWVPNVEEVMHPPETKTDFHHGTVLQAFIGPDGTKLYIEVPAGETRLIFSLAIDGFNPYQNKTAKQKVTSTAIYMVCLNLPPHLRYLPEYMYLVGVIPGPTKPSIDQINHFLRLLVDDLLPFWDPGVWYSATRKYVKGRLYRSALVPLVCDIVGARQVVGTGSHSSAFFCSFCYLPLDDIENFEPASWPPRNVEQHRARAEAWRDAHTEAERERLFDLYGIRWSELLRLPYWDPIRFTVVDSMHNLYLGLLQHHCRDIWGINHDVDDGDATAHPHKPHPPFPSPAKWREGTEALYHGTLRQLAECTKSVLWHLCDRRDLRRAGGKKQLVKTLADWRRRSGLPQPKGSGTLPPLPDLPPPGPAPGSLEDAVARAEQSLHRIKSAKGLVRKGKPVLIAMCVARGIPTEHATVPILAERIWASGRPIVSVDTSRYALGRQSMEAFAQVRETMELPSWITPAPRGFGTTEHGKLSANQWHTDGRKAEMLANFLDLVSAVVIASLLETSSHYVDSYKEYMLRYLRKMKELYKEVSVKPNHHFALHLPEFMTLFAPVHSWRAFAFEHFNYLLQKINTNLTFGELEATFMRACCRAANLRQLLHVRHIGDAFKRFMQVFNRNSGEAERGLRLDAILRSDRSSVTSQNVRGSPENTRLDNNIYKSLLGLLNHEGRSPLYADAKGSSARDGTPRLPYAATRYPKVFIRGIYYHAKRSSPRDSNILFTDPSGGDSSSSSSTMSTHVGAIMDIFTHRRPVSTAGETSEVFLVVSKYAELSLSDRIHDRFRLFPVAGGRLVYDKQVPGYLVIRPSQVLCHVAKTKLPISNIKEPCLQILPLDRLLRFMRVQDNDIEVEEM